MATARAIYSRNNQTQIYFDCSKESSKEKAQEAITIFLKNLDEGKINLSDFRNGSVLSIEEIALNFMLSDDKLYFLFPSVSPDNAINEMQKLYKIGQNLSRKSEDPKISKLRADIDKTNEVMQSSINKIIERGGKLSEVADKTEKWQTNWPSFNKKDKKTSSCLSCFLPAFSTKISSLFFAKKTSQASQELEEKQGLLSLNYE